MQCQLKLSQLIFINGNISLFILDLHDLKRLDFHNSVFEVLRDRLVSKVQEISKSNDDGAPAKLEAILEKSFPLNKIDTLLPVSMCLLKYLPKVLIFSMSLDYMIILKCILQFCT